MTPRALVPDLSGRRVLVPGGTGTVGTGVVRRYLAAGAQVFVPTRTQERAGQFRAVLGSAATEDLHLLVHDYSTFAGAEHVAAQVEASLGGIDHVVAPIGGWWAGRRLWEIDEADWQEAFVRLATAHMAMVRACLPRLDRDGAYVLTVGDSSSWPVPGSGLVSMEQSAVLMMQRVLQAELHGKKRVFVLVLGSMEPADLDGPTGVTADQVGQVAVAASAATRTAGGEIPMHNQLEVQQALQVLGSPAVVDVGTTA